jgi:hypothetical protein
MKPAIIIVDMLEGNYTKPITGIKEEEKIVPVVRDFLKIVRGLDIPVIFACDSFLENDFIFEGRMKPHAIRGTEGTKPLSELEPQPSDIVLDKRRFSAFFKTDLDQTLETLGSTRWRWEGSTLISVCSPPPSMPYATTSRHHPRGYECRFQEEIHESVLDAYRQNVSPIFRV